MLRCSCGQASNFIRCRRCGATTQQLQANFGSPVECPSCADVQTSPKSVSAWDWASDHDEHEEGEQQPAGEATPGSFGSHRLEVPIVSAFRGGVLGFQQTEKGVDVLFGAATIAEVHTLAANFLAARGFEREAGTLGRSTWGRGNAAARAVAGGLVSRAKYTVVISQTTDGVQLSFVSTMSGWSGSLLGVARERSQRKDFVDRLQVHLNSLSAPPAIAPPPSSKDDPATALEQLRELRNRDLLSAEEYQAKRSEIIDRL
jgi:hypothetical protein